MYIIRWLRSFAFKILNFLFGKTTIFITILAWFLIITGAFMLVWPERARTKLVRIGFGQIKWIFIVGALYLVSLLASINQEIGFIVSTVGLIAIIFAYFSFKKDTYRRTQQYFAKIPLRYLKIFSYIQIAIGSVMLILLRL